MITERGCSIAACLDRKIDSHKGILFIEYIIVMPRLPSISLLYEIFMRPYTRSACPSL